MDVLPYTQQTYDVLALRGTTPGKRVEVDQSLADADVSGEIVLGRQKLAQRVLMRLLTGLASMRYARTEGTDFINKLRRGQLSSVAAVRGAFAIAEAHIRAQFERETRRSDTPEERYKSFSLLSVSLEPGTVVLTVAIESQATTENLVLPIPLVS